MRLSRTRHPIRRLTVIVVAGFTLVWFLISTMQSDRARTNRPFQSTELRQIKGALDAYLQSHDGTYPTRLEVLAESREVTDRTSLSRYSFPAAGRRHADLKPSEHIVVQPMPDCSKYKENTPPRFALRADGQIEYVQ
jgi:hypothetical protein